MDLQNNFMKEKNFQRLVLLMLCAVAFFILWQGIKEIQNFQNTFDSSAPVAKSTDTFEIDNLILSKASVNQNGQQRIARYITVADLSYPPSKKKEEKIIRAGNTSTKMMGLMGHPSFLITGNQENFWKSQFYLSFGYHYGGLLLLNILFIILLKTNFRQGKKLFTTQIKYLFSGIFFLLITGYFLGAILYGRMIHFLNENFYLGESLTGGLSTELLGISIAVIFVILLLERAVPMQKEQDLTV